MKKFKVLKNFTHDSKIWKAGEEFITKDKALIESLLEQELVGDPDPAPAEPLEGEKK